MSGEVTVKNSSGWKKNLTALLITAVVILAVSIPVIRTLQERAQTGLMTQMAIAVVVPILIWVLHPQMLNLLPGDKNPNAVIPWTIQKESLLLGEREIPLGSIKMVHCWQKGDAWTINIETTGKNEVLRSAEGDEAARSVRQLYALVDALGYRSQWREV